MYNGIMNHWIFNKIRCMLGMHDIHRCYILKYDEDWKIKEHCQREGCGYKLVVKTKPIPLDILNGGDT